jgi:hypothetical protein
MNKRTANWWLYTSPAGGGGDPINNGSLANLEVEEDGGRDYGRLAQAQVARYIRLRRCRVIRKP